MLQILFVSLQLNGDTVQETAIFAQKACFQIIVVLNLFCDKEST